MTDIYDLCDRSTPTTTQARDKLAVDLTVRTTMRGRRGAATATMQAYELRGGVFVRVRAQARG